MLIEIDRHADVAGEILRIAGVPMPERSVRAAYEIVTGQTISEASWKEIKQMFTDPSEMVASTRKAYAEVNSSLERWHSATAKVYQAREAVMEAVLERNQEKIDSAYADIKTALKELKTATADLVSKTNRAIFMGSALRGFGDEAGLFFVQAICSTASGAAIGKAVSAIKMESAAIRAVGAETMTTAETAATAAGVAGQATTRVVNPFLKAVGNPAVKRAAGGVARVTGKTYDAGNAIYETNNSLGHANLEGI